MRITERIAFGTDLRRKLSGADLYIRILQITSVLPVLYIFLVTGAPQLLTGKSIFSSLFSCGIEALPRGESLFLSWLYRYTSNEVIVYFVILFLALFAGILGNRLFRDNHKSGRTTRKVFAVLLAADLVFRVLPFSFNHAFGFPAAAFGFAVRLACLLLILLDLRADRHAVREGTI